MTQELSALEDRIRRAVAEDDFDSALHLSEAYTHDASSLMVLDYSVEQARAILCRHAGLMQWVRLSAATACAHSASALTLLARASRFLERPDPTHKTRTDV